MHAYISAIQFAWNPCPLCSASSCHFQEGRSLVFGGAGNKNPSKSCKNPSKKPSKHLKNQALPSRNPWKFHHIHQTSHRLQGVSSRNLLVPQISQGVPGRCPPAPPCRRACRRRRACRWTGDPHQRKTCIGSGDPQVMLIFGGFHGHGNYPKIWDSYGITIVESIWLIYGWYMVNIWLIYG